MGVLDHFSDLCSVTTTRKTKRKPMQTVDIKVKMDCDGCERKVKNCVSSIRGVKSVVVNRKESRITVTGYIEPNQVLKKVRKTGKRAEFWPYVPYNLVSKPYAPQAYDKKAPAGYVKNVVQPHPNPNPNTNTNTNTITITAVDQFVELFSDENPNACSVM